MAHQIRKLMKENASLLFSEVEADETMIGGKRKGKRRSGAEGKMVVFGQLQRNGKMNACVVKNVKAETRLPHFQDNIAKGSKLMTDELHSYKKITKVLDLVHKTLQHG